MSWFSKTFGGIERAVSGVVKGVLGIQKPSRPPASLLEIEIPKGATAMQDVLDFKRQREPEQNRSEARRGFGAGRRRKELRIQQQIGTF